MSVLGLVTILVLIPTQISRLSSTILATGVSPKTFPQVAAWGLTIFGLATVFEEVMTTRRARAAATVTGSAAPETSGKASEEDRDADPVGSLMFFAAVVAYVALLPVLGHLIATPIAIAGYMFLLGERHWLRIVLTAALTTVLISLLFRILLNTVLPTGVLY